MHLVDELRPAIGLSDAPGALVSSSFVHSSLFGGTHFEIESDAVDLPGGGGRQTLFGADHDRWVSIT